MASNEEDQTTFTLSIGGVSFCLAPSSPRGDNDNDAISNDAVMSVSKISGSEVLLNLNNFVGTLLVKNTKGEVATSSCGVSPPVATETSMDNECGDDASLSQDEKSDPSAAVPNPVEDTPSPPPKENSVAEDKPAEKNKPKHRKGQQKLNFGKQKGAKKSQKKTSETQKPSIASKRGPTDDDSATNKKPRPSKKAEESEFPESNAGFNGIIEEPKNEPNNNDFTLASMGQSMPSQDNESPLKDNSVFSLDSRTEDDTSNMADEKDTTTISTTKPSASSTSLAIVKKPAQQGAPCPRWGHTQTMIDHRRFIVYGGQTIEKDGEAPKPLADLFVYDLMDGTWTRPVNCDGVARTWHTSEFLPDRRLLLCFGGEVLNEKTGKLVTTDQVMALDCDIMLWYPPTVSGQSPSGRSGHASCVLPRTNELVVFGGVKNGKWLNSASVLDTNRWRWSPVKAVGDAPRPRSYHTATAIGSDYIDVGDRVVIFGGNDGDRCFNSVHVLEASGESNKRRWVWSNPKMKGEPPSPRTGHNATLLSDGTTILIYGGWDPNMEDKNGDDMIFGDSFLLDTKTWTWSKGPKPRFETSKNSTATNGGPNRVGHSAVLAPGSDGVQVLAFGGRLQENEFAGDFQSLVVPL